MHFISVLGILGGGGGGGANDPILVSLYANCNRVPNMPISVSLVQIDQALNNADALLLIAI